MGKKRNSSEPPSLTASLPHDLVVDILARLSRSDYPALSLVSKHFRSIVSSRELYATRSLLGCMEHCLYVFLADVESKCNRCYILRQKTNGSHGLVLVPSLPSLPYGSRFVAVGSRIYVFGTGKDSNTTLSIDCGSYTVQPLPSMHVPLSYTVADVIDGRIYVMGRHDQRDLDKMMVLVFNTETQTWKTDSEMTTSEIYAHGSVVMADKMYAKYSCKGFVYEPKERKWETDEVLNSKEWRFACVVDDVLYYYEFYRDKLRAYDRKQRCWLVVKGLEAFFQTSLMWSYVHSVSYDGKLALFFPYGEQIWCAEISLERSQGGEIWGKVEWCDCLLTSERRFRYTKSLEVFV